MKGIIVLWSGAIVDIPNGWALCDGTQGTPDLRNRFIVGAGDTYAVDASGGATSHDHAASSANDTHNHSGVAYVDYHTHTVDCGSHDHRLQEGTNIIETLCEDFSYQTESIPIVGTTSQNAHGHAVEVANDVHNHVITVNAETELPPYYALAYIMKL